MTYEYETIKLLQNTHFKEVQLKYDDGQMTPGHPLNGHLNDQQMQYPGQILTQKPQKSL
jgi:hypothetical protein